MHVHPPPPPGKKVPLRNVQKRRESSAQICRQKRMCTFRSDTTKLKRKSKGKKMKIVKKGDSRLSELYSRFFFTFIYHCCFEHKQVILAFIFVFIVYRIVSYIFERLFKPSGTGPNVLKS